MMSPSQPSSTLDGLPKQFVNALRTLFDVLDDKGTGFIKFTDIELRWQDDGSKGLPKGVIESLRKVTPPNGLLSFERFCAGLKISLLRNQMEGRGMRREEPVKPRPPSAPLLDLDQTSKPATWDDNRHQQAQRTISMPQLPALKPNLYGPPKPPRVGLVQSQSQTQIVQPNQQPVDKAEIRSALHNWQMGVMIEEERRFPRPRPLGHVSATNNGIIEGNNVGSVQSIQTTEQNQYKKVVGRRREPRRHTLHNGIDYNMLKKMKQIEIEKEILMQGLEAVDKARDWYLKQIAVVQDKMQYIGKMGYSEQWSDAQEERIGLQRARILELNRHLNALVESSERGSLSLHMNLAINPYNNAMGQLKHHNHYLQQEVSKKNDRITTLEREKASLLRELFHTRQLQTARPQPDSNTSYL